MISELDCRILAKACGVCWHDYKIGDGFVSTCSCGRRGCIVREFCGSANPTFSVPDDWELVRVNVVVPNQEAFCEYLDKHGVWPIIWFSLSSEDRNKIAADFIKARPDLFPWAIIEMEEKK
jgi:hypothetical protein